jgi:hypothetical protein
MPNTGQITALSPLQIDMNKVKLDVLKPWITRKIAEFLKMDDDVVVEFVFNQLEEKVRQLFLFVSSGSCIILGTGTVLNVKSPVRWWSPFQRAKLDRR